MMGMFAESPSQLLMLLIPLVTTVLIFLRRKALRRFVGTGVSAAVMGAAIYIFILVFVEGFGPLFLIGYADTLLLYLPICLAVSALLSLASMMLGRRKLTPR